MDAKPKKKSKTLWFNGVLGTVSMVIAGVEFFTGFIKEIAPGWVYTSLLVAVRPQQCRELVSSTEYRQAGQVTDSGEAVKYLKQLSFQRSQSETIQDRGVVAAMTWLKGWPITYGGLLLSPWRMDQ